MVQAFELYSATWLGGRTRNVGLAFKSAAWRHRYIHALAFGTLALAAGVGALTGNRPDIGIVGEFGFYITSAFWIGGCAAAVIYLLWLGLVERARSPLRHFARRIGEFFMNAERWANAVNGIGAFVAFAAGFSVLKGAITYFAPFSWDATLADWGLALHFGRAPYEWLWWFIERPAAVYALNIVYNLWFIVLLGTTFAASITVKDTKLRHQYLLSLLSLWLIGGFFVAMLFSSAGPCYFQRLNLGDRYQPLMEALAHANQSYPIWALSTQDMLWSGYKGLRNGNLGISAFPSLHVGTSVLIAIYASRRSWLVGVMAWLFAATITVGSVVLGWHYGLDAYGGGLIAVAIWAGVGRILNRATPSALSSV
ncbi:phosphatase PAP2 family protein [Mesorhizobium sp. SP-1A]|uniref:phosphatase PAP2 family protein n=1 Tax=Mesorhizobium sp. SP-1A TaxID=3077840 RepID=UPI0028F705B2|nr:phosphatase PAP2 family protein [Mesorhizobium sp. SP-1A]